MRKQMHRGGTFALLAMVGALVGCGGGGSSTGMMGPTPTPMLQVPEGLARSEAAPVAAGSADDTLAMLSEAPGNRFPALSSIAFEHWNDPQGFTAGHEGFHVKSVSGDGAGGFHVVYVLGDTEAMVHFSMDDRNDDGTFTVMTDDGRTLDFWTYSNPPRFEGRRYSQGFGSYFQPEGLDGALRIHVHVGARTETMPTGMASYAGSMYANGFPTGSRDRSARSDYFADVDLTMDLDSATFEGQIHTLRFRGRDEDGDRIDWVRLPETTGFEIFDGRIVGGQFAATLRGVDTNEDAAAAETVRGFSGGVLGEFYGPQAEEVGGALTATSEAHGTVLVGHFGAGKE